MKLKNIVSRKEYKKMYEFIGGREGGLGSNDGFANNVKLKNSMLGGLINGMFRGISWLWKKSKENFIINRLIAKLINELLRGVIIYCFVSNIDLKSGKEKGKIEETEEDKEGQGEEKEETEIEGFELIKRDIKQEIGKEFEPEKVVLGEKDESTVKILKKLFLDPNIDILKIKDINSDYYKKLKDEAYEFLNKNVKDYKNMTDDQKLKMRDIYINYHIIDSLNKKLKGSPSKITNESLNEENIIKPIIKSHLPGALGSHSTSVKVGMSEPMAGKVSPVRFTGIKTGLLKITVGDILTKRDKDKYKENSDDFKSSIHDVNLAEIEKTVEQKNEQSVVSSHVNPESLKVIQLSAEQLFVSDSDKQTSKTKLKWNKEVSRVYSSFVNIMNIEDVDIREKNFRDDLSGKVKSISNKFVDDNKYYEKLNRVADNFDKAISTDESTLSDLGGSWAYYCFEYNNAHYICSIAPVNSTSKSNKFYFIMITKTFTETDPDTYSVNSNMNQFNSIFKVKATNTRAISDPNNVFVFFMFKIGSKFPTGKTKGGSGIRNTILVFNNYKYGNDDELYLCKPSGGKFTNGINVNNINIDKINIDDYKIKVTTESCRKFIDGKIDKWKEQLNLVEDQSNVKWCNFEHDKKPKVLTDDVINKLQMLAKKI